MNKALLQTGKWTVGVSKALFASELEKQPQIGRLAQGTRNNSQIKGIMF